MEPHEWIGKRVRQSRSRFDFSGADMGTVVDARYVQQWGWADGAYGLGRGIALTTRTDDGRLHSSVDAAAMEVIAEDGNG